MQTLRNQGLSSRDARPSPLVAAGLGLAMFFASGTILGPALARAQPPGEVTVVAVPGEPFGVARIRLPLPPNVATETPIDAGQVIVTSREGRVFYPAWRDITVTARTGPPLEQLAPGRGVGEGRLLGRIRNIIRTATSEEVEQTVGKEVWFLFSGAEPFTVTVDYGPRAEIPIRPQGPPPVPGNLPTFAPDAHQAAVQDWWTAYTDMALRRIRSGDYPPLVESYLVAMLAGRLGLALPEELVPQDPLADDSIASMLELVAGTEEMRSRILQRVAQGDTELGQRADRPLPPEPQWTVVPPPPPSSAEPAELEPMATRVPFDAFYVRFGSFANYLWFRELGNQHGGDLSRMVTLRGFDYGTSKRTEDQLALQTTELSKVVGPSVVDDMAFIGYDAFLNEGASIGVLMRAKNVFLLSTSLRNDRAAALRTVPGATMRDLEIDGTTVSFLSTPDNRLRSFMVNVDEYILVANSETLVRAFLAIRDGAATLADSEGFRYARELMPAENDYTIFAYFSSPFFQRLAGPQYQIELRRRMNATADISLVQLAQTAARGEGLDIHQVDELVAAGFLPQGIGRRPDGSGPIVEEDRVIDSRRGQRGSFLPIADVRIDGVTAEEEQWYARRAQFYASQWQQMDPLLAGIRRLPSPGGGLERLEIHAEVAPLVPEKYGWVARQLGPPTRVAIQFAPDDIVAAQAHVVSDRLGGSIPPHHLFLALKDDLLPNPAELEGFFDRYRALQSLAGYVGAWPQPGLIDRLPLGIGRGRPVGPGMTRLIGGLYRYQGGGFSVVAFLPDVITASLPHLAAVEVGEPAQVRAHIDNLQGTQLEAWANQQMYQRSYQTSVAGAQLLNSLTSQLKVDQDDAPRMVEHLLDARLQCPLGGEYVLAGDAGSARWISTAWEQAPRPGVMPDDYMSPVLRWFRGLSGRLTQYESRLVADILLDMDSPTAAMPTTDTEPEETLPAPEAASPEAVTPEASAPEAAGRRDSR